MQCLQREMFFDSNGQLKEDAKKEKVYIDGIITDITVSPHVDGKDLYVHVKGNVPDKYTDEYALHPHPDLVPFFITTKGRRKTWLIGKRIVVTHRLINEESIMWTMSVGDRVTKGSIEDDCYCTTFVGCTAIIMGPLSKSLAYMDNLIPNVYDLVLRLKKMN